MGERSPLMDTEVVVWAATVIVVVVLRDGTPEAVFVGQVKWSWSWGGY